MSPRGRWRWAVRAAPLLLLGLGLGLAAPTSARLPGYGPRVFGDRPTVDEMTRLGAQLFRDPALSASGRQSCASCHDPAHGFAPANRQPVQFGGPALATPGHRATPSLMYLQALLPFTEHYIDDEDGHGVDAGPTGGMAWDGRLDSLHEQARVPLFASHEMGNANAKSLAARLRRSPYAASFRRAFSDPGQDVFEHPEAVVAWVAQALEVYQQDAATFYPFTSKYDAALRGQVRLDDAELRGLKAFEDPNRGNCASCHPSGRRSDGGFPSFTDAGYAALGLPRNRELAANRDPAFFDMGLCGPDRSDLAPQRQYCGMFKTPSLRNVALRGSFFHNGVFHELRDAVAFYATRDLEPARWYPKRADGGVERFDDLPQDLRGNVNAEVPFAPRPDGRPRLGDAEVDDIVTFLRTLTDGWKPPSRMASH